MKNYQGSGRRVGTAGGTTPKKAKKDLAVAAREAALVLPETVSVALLVFVVGAGLKVVQTMMEHEVEALAGPKGRHDTDRVAVRHGRSLSGSHRLDHGRGVYDLADHRREGEERGEPLPRRSPDCHDAGVALAVLEFEGVHGVRGGFGADCGVDRPQRRCDPLAVLPKSSSGSSQDDHDR